MKNYGRESVNGACLPYRPPARGTTILKKTSKPHVSGLCEGNSLVTGGFSSQRASNVEKCGKSFHLMTSSWFWWLCSMHTHCRGWEINKINFLPILRNTSLALGQLHNRPVSQMRASVGDLSQTSGKLWQDYSSCYMFLNIKRNNF